MARGWESKSVEEQQASFAQQDAPASPRLSPAQQKIVRQRDGLLLSRKRLVEQLQTTVRPRHRELLKQAIAELDRQLSSFDKPTEPPTG